MITTIAAVLLGFGTPGWAIIGGQTATSTG